MNDDFYIGWSNGSNESRRTSKSFFFTFLGLMILLISIFVFFEKPFSDSSFAYGELTELEGELLEKPVISIRVPNGEGFDIIPLVGFGKMGPHAALSSLLGKGSFHVKLEGTLIQYKGNKLFELTEGQSSILTSIDTKQNLMVGEMGAMMEVTGEIVDPKCFFGVMKPGFGKVHKSCAIRCISGQIPPILALRNEGEFTDYYFLTDSEGEVLMQDLHEYVGSEVKVIGLTFQVDNWKSIRVQRLETPTRNVALAMTLCKL